MKFEGMAKPTEFAPEMIAVDMPITRPSRSKIGPPELPWLMAASVCRKASRPKARWCSSRPLPEMMPVVTVIPRPSPLPMATTQSPTSIPSESPRGTKV